MDTKIKVNQEVPSELVSQHESDSFPKELTAIKNNDIVEWYDDCETGIKTEIKREAPVIGCFSQTERQVFIKDLVKKIKLDTYTYINDTEIDTEAVEEESLDSDVYSESKRQFPSQDLINKKEYSSDCEIEIKEEPFWLGRAAEAVSYCEEIQDGRKASKLPRTVLPAETTWWDSRKHFSICTPLRRKATGDDDIPTDLLKELGENGLRNLTELISRIYDTGEWPKDFLEVTMIALKKKQRAKTCSDHRTISLISHVGKIVAWILTRRLESKIKGLIED